MILSSLKIKNIKRVLPVALLIVLTSIFIISLEVKVPRFFLDNDNSTKFLPYFQYNWRAVIENRTIPFINLHQSLGEPYMGVGQHGLLYPPIYLSIGLSLLLFQVPFYAVDILVSMHLILAGVFMYLLLRRFSVQSTYSVLLSLMWITFPYNIFLSRSWANMSFLTAFLPLNFIFLHSFLKKPTLKSAVILAVIKTFHFFSGHPHLVIILIMLEMLFVCFFIIPTIDRHQYKKTFKVLFPYMASLVLTGLLAAPLLLSMNEVKGLSEWRSSPMSFEKVMANSVKSGNFWPAQIFDFKKKAIYDSTSDILYFGWFNLGILILLLSHRIRKKKAPINLKLYGGLALVSFLLSTSLYRYLYPFSPFNVLQGPHKYFPFALFFATVAIAGIVQRITKNRSNKAQIPLLVLFVLSIAINITLVWRNPTNTLIKQPIEFPIKLEVADYLDKTGRVVTQYTSSNRKHQYKYLAFDYATLFGYYHFGGFNPLLPKINHDLTYGLYFSNHLKKHPSQEVLDHLSTWSVKYFINTSNSNKKIPQLTKIFQQGNLKLYKNNAAKPFVYSLQNPEQHIVYNMGINHINIFPTNQEDQTLVISFPPLPRWYLFLDDKPVGRIKHKNLSSPIEVAVPAGIKKVTVRYVDYAFIFGTIISLSTLLSICAWLLYRNKKIVRARRSVRID